MNITNRPDGWQHVRCILGMFVLLTVLAEVDALPETLYAVDGNDLVLVEDHQPKAVVVLAEDPSRVSIYAAEELVSHVKEATAVKLPVVSESRISQDYPVRVFLGTTREAPKRELRTAHGFEFLVVEKAFVEPALAILGEAADGGGKMEVKIAVELPSEGAAGLENAGVEALFARQLQDEVGFCSYVVDQARKCGTVGFNGVAKSHQGTGIGSVMMDFVMDGIRSEGMEYAVVLVADNEAHIPALRNYEKHGFRRLTGYHELVRKL